MDGEKLAQADTLEVSVIIPLYGDASELRPCVDGLTAQKLPQDKFEVIVIDNGPLEGAATRLDLVRHQLAPITNVQVLHQPSPGSYAARNVGVRAARAPIFAFTDADCLPQPGWLTEGLDALSRDPDTDAIAGAVEVFARDPDRPTGVELYELVLGFQQEKYVATAGFGATANVLARRGAFDRIGLFDESLRSGGDKDWGHRLRAAGGLMRFEPAAVVRHPARHDIAELRAKIRRVADGDLILRHRRGWIRLNWLRYAINPIRPPLRAIWRSREDPRLRSRSQWLRYGLTFTLARWITSFYRLRLASRWPPTSADTRRS